MIEYLKKNKNLCALCCALCCLFLLAAQNFFTSNDSDPFSMGPGLVAESAGDSNPFSMGPPLGAEGKTDAPKPEKKQ